MNIHIHPVNLKHASRILKCLESAGRSRCFAQRMFIGAGAEQHYSFDDAAGDVRVQLFPRSSGPKANFVKKAMATWAWTRRVKSYSTALAPRCVNVHGLSTLPLGVALKRRTHCKLIYDTHELESRAFAVRGVRRLYSERLERVLIHHCDAVVCVSDGIADWYSNHYGVARPLVVRNVPDGRSQLPLARTEVLRAKYKIHPEALLFLYQGKIASGRMIEQILEVFNELGPEYQVIFLGDGELEPAVRRASAERKNVHHHPAVDSKEVIAYTGQCDIGLIGVENRCLSYYFALPNKLFECLAAGLPVVAPCLPEIKRIVDRYECGWNWDGTTQGLKSLLSGISTQEIAQRRNGARLAASQLSWENEEQGLLKLYRRLLQTNGTPKVLQAA